MDGPAFHSRHHKRNGHAKAPRALSAEPGMHVAADPITTRTRRFMSWRRPMAPGLAMGSRLTSKVDSATTKRFYHHVVGLKINMDLGWIET
jgi:hypothetical protein